ncbi:MAG: ADP/ATP-dependent (S)-NAD(P)H-hydrate dehydratase, partial [Leptolyngbyaceae bacterium]|nr:ADP/ATP-dependent (S)-NAD(P)H-hydrate dehydratase [Leptolyngbyaceae bacterium]
QDDPDAILKQRSSPTVLTPHPGEFKRLFPGLGNEMGDRLSVAKSAAQASHSILVLKGARTVVAYPDGRVYVNPESTAALARGGSGDVLTGLLGGLMAQAVARGRSVETVVPTAVWWHSQGAIAAAQENTELGVDASTLITYLKPTLNCYINT